MLSHCCCLITFSGIGGKDSGNVFGLTDSGEMILSPTSEDDPVQRINPQRAQQSSDLQDCDEFTKLLVQDDARMLVDLLKLAVAGKGYKTYTVQYLMIEKPIVCGPSVIDINEKRYFESFKYYYLQSFL